MLKPIWLIFSSHEVAAIEILWNYPQQGLELYSQQLGGGL